MSDGACECLTCVLTKDDLLRLAEESRRNALLEAYWKLRDHAASRRDTASYRGAQERGGRSLLVMENRCRGLEDGARDIAEMLGVEEHEIERPVGSSEVTDGR